MKIIDGKSYKTGMYLEEDTIIKSFQVYVILLILYWNELLRYYTFFRENCFIMGLNFKKEKTVMYSDVKSHF